MNDFLKILKGIGIIIMIAPPIIGLLMIATGNGSSSGGSWKQKREKYERERSERLYMDEQKRMQENTIRYQSIPTVQPTYSSSSSRSNYAELWDECEDLESALNDADIDHEDLSYPMDYHDLEDLRDEYQSLLEENNIDY
jgi:hypothetical protein